MRRSWVLNLVALAAVATLALFAGCDSGDGDDPVVDTTTGPSDTADGDITEDIVADVVAVDIVEPGPDTAADVPVVVQISGCVACHTDKDRLVALAPEEEEAEESGGG